MLGIFIIIQRLNRMEILFDSHLKSTKYKFSMRKYLCTYLPIHIFVSKSQFFSFLQLLQEKFSQSDGGNTIIKSMFVFNIAKSTLVSTLDTKASSLSLSALLICVGDQTKDDKNRQVWNRPP